MLNLEVGTTVKLKDIAMLGNPEGTKGVVIDNYTIGDTPGATIIFENGNYDGFSLEEQEMFLEKTDFNTKISGYQFTNVIKLSQDFDKGLFNSALFK